MKNNQFLQYVLYDIFGEQKPITARAMMGAHVLYYEGKAFAIVEKEELYFKGSRDLASWYMCQGSKRFTYTKEGKDAYLNYFFVPQEVYEDRILLEEWLYVTLSVAKLPKNKNK